MSVPPRLLGRRVVAVEDLTRPWARAVRTSLVTLEDGLAVVHQAGLPTTSGRAGVALRIRRMRALAAAAPGLPVPRVLDGDPAADPPFLVSAFVPGRSGGELLGSDADAMVLGRVTGEAAVAVAGVPPGVLGAAARGPWSNPVRLRAAASRWLAAAAGPSRDAAVAALRIGEVPAMARILDRAPGLFAAGWAGFDGEAATGGGAVLAHGDLAPVNLVVDGERLAGLLDLERLRAAPVAFDVAWFRLLVRHHHPEAWPAAGPAVLAATGLGGGPEVGGRPEVLARLDDLAVLACLEAAESLPRRSTARTNWLARAGAIVRGELPGP